MADEQNEHDQFNEAERPVENFPVVSIAASPSTAEAPPFPRTSPNQYPKSEEDVEFDPVRHLANPLEVPTNINVLRSDDDSGPGCVKLINVPSSDERKMFAEDLAYTEPFRVLSDEGVTALRKIIDDNRTNMSITTKRNPEIIRGLAFASKFVRDYNESPELLRHLSKFANVPLAAHPMTTNYSQINYGEPPEEGETAGKAADVWHVDSVDYVLVLMLTGEFEGGELLVSTMDPKQAIERIATNDLPEELISKNIYPGPGYGIFMQGSRIAHAVAPLTGGKSRITAVNSYASCDSMRIDRSSIYHALSRNHTKEVYDPDYLRNVAWRCMGKLNHLVTDPQYDNPKGGEDILDLVIDQLTSARSLMKGKGKFYGDEEEEDEEDEDDSNKCQTGCQVS